MLKQKISLPFESAFTVQYCKMWEVIRVLFNTTAVLCSMETMLKVDELIHGFVDLFFIVKSRVNRAFLNTMPHGVIIAVYMYC